MGLETALLASAIIGGVGTAASVYQGNKVEREQRNATNQATQNAKVAADASAQANNKVNQKRPDTGALLSANLAGNSTGLTSTMLTGANGIDPNTLQLGKNTLLGGGS